MFFFSHCLIIFIIIIINESSLTNFVLSIPFFFTACFIQRHHSWFTFVVVHVDDCRCHIYNQYIWWLNIVSFRPKYKWYNNKNYERNKQKKWTKMWLKKMEKKTKTLKSKIHQVKVSRKTQTHMFRHTMFETLWYLCLNIFFQKNNTLSIHLVSMIVYFEFICLSFIKFVFVCLWFFLFFHSVLDNIIFINNADQFR